MYDALLMMKEAPKFEVMLPVLLRKPGLWRKVLLGGLLSFLPLVNLLAFGYLLQVCRDCRRHGVVVLPEWSGWKGLLLDGLRFAAAWLLYWLVPVLLAELLAGLLDSVGLGVLGYFLQVAALLGGSLLLCAGLYRFQRRSSLRDLLDVLLIFRMARGLFPAALVAVLAASGLAAICWPLYGLAFFFSLLPLIVYTTLYFRWIEEAAVGRDI